MREQLRKTNLAFAVLREFRPEFRHSALESDIVLLQDLQNTRAPETLRRRPKEDESVWGPGRFAPRIPKAAVKIEKRLAELPDGDRGTQFSEMSEVFLKERGDSLSQL